MIAWTGADDDRLRALWGVEPLARLAPSFARSQACVHNRARKLGLVSCGVAHRFERSPWTDAEDDAIRDGWTRIDSRAVAAGLNRSHDAVRRRARKLGLVGTGRVRSPGPTC